MKGNARPNMDHKVLINDFSTAADHKVISLSRSNKASLFETNQYFALTGKTQFRMACLNKLKVPKEHLESAVSIHVTISSLSSAAIYVLLKAAPRGVWSVFKTIQFQWSF